MTFDVSFVWIQMPECNPDVMPTRPCFLVQEDVGLVDAQFVSHIPSLQPHMASPVSLMDWNGRKIFLRVKTSLS